MELRFDFASDDTTTGFRIKYFELYNWGTFDKKIVRINLDGHNALLTGDIGSGKSTIVDGLTTLLVPHQKITFNKAAGAESKERNLKSYIIGEYKSQKDDTFGSSKAVSLRNEKGITVLLARFENEGYEESFTIAQFFYIRNGKVNKFFITSKSDMNIKEDFLDINYKNVKVLKKYLREKEHTEVYENFSDYSKDFKRTMGIKNDQALNLFYQTVSLKAIGNLTNFVREQMLDAGDIDTKIEELCQNFSDLNRAHNLVVSARKQIELLIPVDKSAKEYEELNSQYKHNELMRDGLSRYFASFKETLLIKKLEELEIELKKRFSQKIKVDEQINNLRNEQVSIKVEIGNNGGDRLKQLKQEIQSNQKELDSKKESNKKYNHIIKELELPTVSNEHRFFKNQESAKKRLSEIRDLNLEYQEKIKFNNLSLSKYEEKFDEIKVEIAYLQHNRSNIPKRISNIRDEIAKYLQVDQAELPFVGELIKVEDEEWSGAIERILHSFSLSLLISQEYYEKVSEYVNRTYLKGKLVYLKVVDNKKRVEYFERAKNSLLTKIKIKADSPYFEQLKGMIEKRFDIPCVQSMEDFRKFKQALTKNGQFKTNYTRHEKDDRFKLNDKRRWTLGWDNAIKLEAMQKESIKLGEKIAILESSIKSLHVESKRLQDERDNLRDILQFDSFDIIDWYTNAKKIDNLNEELEELQKSSNILKSLENQLSKIDKELSELTSKREKIVESIGELKTNISLKKAELNEVNLVLQEKLDDAISLKLDALFSKDGLHLGNIFRKERDLRETIQNELNKISKKIKRTSEKLLELMHKYKNQYVVESKEFDASIGSINDFRVKLNELKKDDLPKFEKRFKSLFKEKTIQKTIMIQKELEQQSSQIKDKIKKINNSLKDIEYNNGTFIELVAELTLDSEIRDFKEELKSATSFAYDTHNSFDEGKFLRIKEIIDRFNGREKFSEVDKRWRAKVSDVRQWYSFSASEKYIANNEEKEYYAHSSGKSGGQKEKLAYTVLASSLAFQFGLEHNKIQSRSFRFVMIDEAFGKGSDESTRYALRLFEKLNLQLLAITPKQKINIIEEFVKSIHFVHNQDGMNSSLLSMSIEEYKKNKK